MLRKRLLLFGLFESLLLHKIGFVSHSNCQILFGICCTPILTDKDPRLQIVPNPSFYIVQDIQQSDLVRHSELSAVQDLHIDHQSSRANLL